MNLNQEIVNKMLKTYLEVDVEKMKEKFRDRKELDSEATKKLDTPITL